MTPTESTQTTIDAAMSVFTRIAPESAEIVAPFVAQLFHALAHGNTFIYVNQQDIEKLAHAEPIVSTRPNTPLILSGQRLFLAKSWHLERELATQIQRLSTHRPIPNHSKTLQTRLQQWFNDAGSHDQQAAAALALVKNFVLISGGPGTGKTTTVAKLLALLCHNDTLPRTALVAPTGKAAARLSEALQHAITSIPHLSPDIHTFLTQLRGQTVHRLLGIKPPQMQPEFHAQQRLPLDIVLLDEASMLDNHLFFQLLDALPENCRVILLGDANQLPSVGAGAVLSALSQSSSLLPETQAQLHQLLPERQQWNTLSESCAHLTISHRFHAKSGIATLAQQVLSGSLNAWETFSHFPTELTQLTYQPNAFISQLHQQHKDYWQAIDSGDIAGAFTAQQQLIVLTALRSDAERINAHYRQWLQQHARVRPETTWYAGQMLLITRNAPTQNLYNGDIGIVMQPKNSQGLTVCFTDKNGYRNVPLSRLPEHETAFALTVHKSQGSQYQQVWYIAPKETHASRALLYTALTRAQQQFIYWGDETSFQAACAHHETRRSALAQFLHFKH